MKNRNTSYFDYFGLWHRLHAAHLRDDQLDFFATLAVMPVRVVREVIHISYAHERERSLVQRMFAVFRPHDLAQLGFDHVFLGDAETHEFINFDYVKMLFLDRIHGIDSNKLGPTQFWPVPDALSDALEYAIQKFHLGTMARFMSYFPSRLTDRDRLSIFEAIYDSEEPKAKHLLGRIITFGTETLCTLPEIDSVRRKVAHILLTGELIDFNYKYQKQRIEEAVKINPIEILKINEVRAGVPYQLLQDKKSFLTYLCGGYFDPVLSYCEEIVATTPIIVPDLLQEVPVDGSIVDLSDISLLIKARKDRDPIFTWQP
jgi:hypothetical protein